MNSAAFFYDAGGSDRSITVEDGLKLEGIEKHQLVWFDVDSTETGILELVRDGLNLPRDALLQGSNRPNRGITVHEGLISFSLTRAGIGDDQVHFVVGQQWLATVHQGPVSYFTDFRDRDRGESLLGHLTPLALAGSLIDWHLEEFHQQVEAIQGELDQLESLILHQRSRKSPLVELTKLRRSTARLRARLEWHRPLVHAMLRPDFYPAAEEEQSAFFHTLAAHYDRAEDALDRARELVVGSFDLYASQTAQNTNDLVRGLTVVTVAIGISAALAGIFGMNFDIPFFHTGLQGFLLVTAGMIIVAFALFSYAKRCGWI